MKWELEALKHLSKNETVPGIALRDAISEIERLRQKLAGRIPTVSDALKSLDDLGKDILTSMPGSPLQRHYAAKYRDLSNLIQELGPKECIWTYADSDWGQNITCSACDIALIFEDYDSIGVGETYRYCPSCGARIVTTIRKDADEPE